MKKWKVTLISLGGALVILAWIGLNVWKSTKRLDRKADARAEEKAEKIKIRREIMDAYERNLRINRLGVELAYLKRTDNVKWIEYGPGKKNEVYIGFDPVPGDWEKITKEAALCGWQACRKPIRFFAFDAGKAGKRPGAENCLGDFTAEVGIIIEKKKVKKEIKK